MMKFLHKSCQWLAALTAMFAMGTSAMAQDATLEFEGSIKSSHSAVTATADGIYSNGVNIYYSANVGYDWGLTISCSSAKIVKIEYTGFVTNWGSTGNYEQLMATDCGNWDADSRTWTGSSNSVLIHATSDTDIFITGAKVWVEGGLEPEGGEDGEGGDEPTDYAAVVSVSPAEGNIDLNVNEYGLGSMTIFMEGNWDKSVFAGEGNPVPAGVTLVGPDGAVTINDSYGFCMWEGSDQINVNHTPYSLTTPGEYTLHIPAGLNTINGKQNPEMTFTWTVTAASTFKVDSWGGVVALGEKSNEWTMKNLTGFQINAPEGVTFASIAEGAKLQTREWGEEGYVYADVEATLSVNSDENTVLVTFPTAYTEAGSYSFTLTEGAIVATDGRTSKEISLSASVDPMTYFDITVTPADGGTIEGPLDRLVITIPEGITVSAISTTNQVNFGGWMCDPKEWKQEGNVVTLIFPEDKAYAPGWGFWYTIPKGLLITDGTSTNNSVYAYNIEVTVNTGIQGITLDAQDGNIYDLTGRRVMTVKNGISIMNGKKVIK